MPASPLAKVLRRLHSSALARDGAGLTDGQLLECFVARRDEAAFEALLRRHGPMVQGVCRRVTRDAHDAEDAFQAAFLVLARKAAGIGQRERVGNWLYGVAYRTALEARTATLRRRAREKQVTDMPHPAAPPESTWHELQPLLDQELNRLPEKYRLPVVLCDLEGRPRKEAARQLRLPEGTLSSRLATARKTLAQRLARRGLALSGGAVAALLAENAATASVPPALITNTVHAATLIAAGHAAAATGISVSAANLTEGVIKMMWLSKLRIVMSALALFAVTGLGAGSLLFQTQASDAADSSDQTRSSRPMAESGVRSKAALAPEPKESDEKAIKKEREKLQGVWISVGGAYKGKELPEEEIDAVLKANHWQKMVFADDHFTWGSVIDEEAMKGTFEINPLKKPKTIDLSFRRDGKDVVGKCIYELDGDTLKVSYGEPDRPEGFKTTEDSDMPRVYVWKKKKD
jgi:RNA polymerase sigma-70 factor (ECF subfamily)